VLKLVAEADVQAPAKNGARNPKTEPSKISLYKYDI
jgi:hypothetical protein